MKKTVGCGMFMQFLTVFCYVSDYRIFFHKKADWCNYQPA